MRGKPNPLLKIGDADHGNRDGEELWALKDVSFTVEQGEVLGIIGRNGAGKSTLLKILSRVTAPTSGKIKVKGRIASLLEVGTGFHPELTGRENIYLNGAILGMSKQEVARKFDEIVDFAEVEKFIDTPVKRYSSGMYVRLAFAVAAHLEPEILVVDEVLAVGDAEFQKKCLGKMGDVAHEGRTVLFVSHNMGAVAQICQNGLFLEAGRIKLKGTIDNLVLEYFGHGTHNYKQFSDGPVKEIFVEQRGIDIYVMFKYNLVSNITKPCLGFQVSDSFGSVLFGTNPKVDLVDNTLPPHSKGEIKVHITQPKLLNGTYRMRFWFGDGCIDDFFIDKEGVLFDVVNMTSAVQRPIDKVGAIYPQCEWDFSAE